ncbi:hypothetical protein HZH66_006990 [Vespula vulgaris]|uniref:Uncharacterized protein n=1 Tax=Vespula vulgaris TaxID=7454 RepID=A0A834JWU0_VESVU|nr:hypothetical protein HZH66_006990 [Vespula vulgaris]
MRSTSRNNSNDASRLFCLYDLLVSVRLTRRNAHGLEVASRSHSLCIRKKDNHFLISNYYTLFTSFRTDFTTIRIDRDKEKEKENISRTHRDHRKRCCWPAIGYLCNDNDTNSNNNSNNDNNDNNDNNNSNNNNNNNNTNNNNNKNNSDDDEDDNN